MRRGSSASSLRRSGFGHVPGRTLPRPPSWLLAPDPRRCALMRGASGARNDPERSTRLAARIDLATAEGAPRGGLALPDPRSVREFSGGSGRHVGGRRRSSSPVAAPGPCAIWICYRHVQRLDSRAATRCCGTCAPDVRAEGPRAMGGVGVIRTRSERHMWVTRHRTTRSHRGAPCMTRRSRRAPAGRPAGR